MWYGHMFPFIRSGQKHLTRHSEGGKKTRQTEEKLGRQHRGIESLGFHQSQSDTGCDVICSALTTVAAKGEVKSGKCPFTWIQQSTKIVVVYASKLICSPIRKHARLHTCIYQHNYSQACRRDFSPSPLTDNRLHRSRQPTKASCLTSV